MEKKRIIIYDFETNGLWNRLTQPIQVHFRIIEPSGSVWSWEEYVACKWIPYDIVLMTGITVDLLRERGRPIEEVFKRIKDMLFECDSLLVGQNILRFDNHFLNYYLQKHFTNRWQVGRERCFDTAAEFKAKLMGLTCPDGVVRGDWHHQVIYTRAKGISSDLQSACSYYGVPYVGAHTAGGDVEMTHKVFLAQCAAAGLRVPGGTPVVGGRRRGRPKKVA